MNDAPAQSLRSTLLWLRSFGLVSNVRAPLLIFELHQFDRIEWYLQMPRDSGAPASEQESNSIEPAPGSNKAALGSPNTTVTNLDSKVLCMTHLPELLRLDAEVPRKQGEARATE